MKFDKILFLFIFLQLLFFAAHSFAADTDLYVGSSSSIAPNILIIFDTSGSMNDEVSTGNVYDPAITYPTHPDHTEIVATKVYRKLSPGEWFSPLTVFKNSISEVGCATAQTILTNKGVYTGRTDSTCTWTWRTLATGNYLNFYLASDGMVGYMSKIDIAKTVIKDFLDTITDVRIGLMRFGSIRQDGTTDSDEGGRKVPVPSLANPLDMLTLNPGTKLLMQNAVDSLSANGWTPLAEVLYEAGLYFRGAESYFNYSGGVKVQYTTPIQYYCQKNFVILMTDGISTQDRNTILNSIGDWDNDYREPIGAVNDPGFTDNGSDYLDDVVKYLYDNDLSTTFQNKQNIATYTIGFELDSSDPANAPLAKDLLRRAATHGHGKFYTTSGTVGLTDAFSNILNEVLANTSSFVAPIVPVSKMERTTAGDKIYLAFFRPNSGKMWSGNIKKYGVQQTNDPSKGLVIGDLTDSFGSKALDSNGAFYPSTKSFWTTSSSDGGDVELGGVGEILKARTTARKIYTLLPGDPEDEDDGHDLEDTSYNLTNSWNAFTTANPRLTTYKLGVSTTDEKNKLIDFVHGIDVYDDNVNGSTTDKRDWFLGSFLHSRPYIIHYADRTVIYAGANDGMLHAFDDATGEELWGFIPPCLLDRLKELHTETPGIFVDGSPKAYVSYNSDGVTVNKAILIFGLRRGGNYYYALDVTNPTVPKYLWRIYKDKGGVFKELGQTWSNPVIGKVAYGTGEKWVAIFGGGYDTGQDEDNPVADDVGRGIYIVDVLTGALVRGMSYAEGETAMTYSIPSDVAPVDLDGDEKIDRVYVGDMNSRMWRVDLGDLGKNGSSDPNEWTVKKIFEPDLAEKRKVFYPPDVTFEKDSTGEYEMLFFGTGNREDPKLIRTTLNRLYALKDKNYSGTLSKTNLVDVTSFYAKTAAEQTTMLNNIQSNYGWYINLDKKEGEKCLATPMVYNKTVYFTTFSPSPQATGDPCFVGEGTGALYAMNYATGEAVFNFDLTNDVGGVVKSKTDRSALIGTAIPSGVVITVIGGKVTAYIGVGGGVYKPSLTSTKSLFPMHWKLVF